ncbi:hypothetical protein [Chrysosporum bergii]
MSSRRYGQGGFPKPYGKQALWSPSYTAIISRPNFAYQRID